MCIRDRTGVVPLPDDLDKFIRMTAANLMNQALWGQNKALRHWMREARLDGFSKLVSGVDPDDNVKADFKPYAGGGHARDGEVAELPELKALGYPKP